MNSQAARDEISRLQSLRLKQQDDIDVIACERDTWMERAENAEKDLRVFQERLGLAIGSFERDGDKTLLLDRVCDILE